jgi:GYD domain
MKAGGAARRAAADDLAKNLGGAVESYHFGDDDAYVICDLPDNKATATLAMTVSSSGRGVSHDRGIDDRGRSRRHRRRPQARVLAPRRIAAAASSAAHNSISWAGLPTGACLAATRRS